MKTLNKRNDMSKNSVEAYALGCGCTCTCYCFKFWKINLYSNSWANVYSTIAMTPKVG